LFLSLHATSFVEVKSFKIFEFDGYKTLLLFNGKMMMVNTIKKAFFGFVDKAMAQEGRVLKVKKWEPSGMYEVRVSLPHVEMGKWNAVPRIKVKVAEFEYRDYSPAEWNINDRTCTLFVEGKHAGKGSNWVQHLEAGQTFLFAPAYTVSLPSAKGNMLCLGDGTALGHFLALKLLISSEVNSIDIVMALEGNAPASMLREHPELRIVQSHPSSLDSIHRTLATLHLKEYRFIYLAGHIHMVQALRKTLKADPTVSAKIFTNGFWS
jgi:NAD(P)H-flavin reductase